MTDGGSHGNQNRKLRDRILKVNMKQGKQTGSKARLYILWNTFPKDVLPPSRLQHLYLPKSATTENQVFAIGTYGVISHSNHHNYYESLYISSLALFLILLCAYSYVEIHKHIVLWSLIWEGRHSYTSFQSGFFNLNTNHNTESSIFYIFMLILDIYFW